MKKLRIIIASLLVCAIAAGVLSSSAFAATQKMGDVDLDSRITVEDALLVLRSSAGLSTLTDAQKAVADVTYDGNINSADALRILLYISGNILTLEKLGGEEGEDIIV